MKRTITGITSGGFAEDLSRAHVSFGTSLGVPITCEFTPQVLERMITGLSEMAQRLRNQIAAKGGTLQVDAVPVKDATAASPVGGGKVVLAIRAENNNVLYQFALIPDVALRLSADMREAVESATRQAAQTRQ